MDDVDQQLIIGDAFGHALRRCWDSGAAEGVAFDIIERDDGHIQARDVVHYFKLRQQWSAVEQWGCDQVAGRVLDVGCGAGRHAVELQDAGHDIVGVDPSPGAIEISRSRGITAIEGTVADLRDDIGRFDTVIMMGNNLALIGPGDAGAELLNQLAVLCAPGARLIGSGMDPYATTTPDHLEYHECNRQRGRLPGHAMLRVRDRRLASEWFDYVLRSPGELEDALRGTAWQLREVQRDGANYCALLDLSP